MRVTWLCLEWPGGEGHAGGVGRYVYRLAQEMRERVELTVVGPANSRQLAGVEVVAMRSARSRLDRYYCLPVEARHIVAATTPDLVHAHGDDWALERHPPVVRSFYGRSWSEAMTSRGWRRWNHVLLAGLEHLSARRASIRLGIAPESVTAFRCHYLFPPLARLHTPAARAPTAEPSVLFIGSHQGRKRGWLVEQTVDAVQNPLGGPLRLVVVGPETDRGSWAEWVEHRSGLDDEGVRHLLAAAWVLVAPSEYEGFGIPAIEALHAGVAVITSPTPGSEYLLQQAGVEIPLLVATDDDLPRLLLQRLRHGPSLSDAERRAAHSRVHSLVSESSAERLERIYESLHPRFG